MEKLSKKSRQMYNINMKVAIVGYEREGRVAFEYWSRGGHDTTICDQDPDKNVPQDVPTQLGPDYLKDLGRFDLVVRTAGLYPGKIVQANPQAPGIADKITTSVDEFLRVSPTRNIVGITGTKGKGTTSVLTAKMLEAAGYRVHLGGNIGIPPLQLLDAGIGPDDWVVLELSSFQLTDLKRSPRIAVCVMMAEEHLNWHRDLDEYITAKQQLFRWQKPDDVAIYYGPDELSERIASGGPGQLIPYMQAPGAEVLNDERIVIGDEPICKTSEIKLLGKHNWQNICAALTAVWQVTHDARALRQAIIGTTALEHRLEPVREVGGVQYYNDSFASAPGSTVAALDAVPGPKVLIVGGLDKGLDLTELADGVSAHKRALRKVLIIGEIAPRISRTLKAYGFGNYEILTGVTMPDIVKHAAHAAQVGDSVLLSPGSSSFDMFKDFVDRGEQFKEAVNEL